MFSLADVKLTGGPFLHAIKLNRDQVLLDAPDRLLALFLAEAGLKPKAPRYPEMGEHGPRRPQGGTLPLGAGQHRRGARRRGVPGRLDYMVAAELARRQEAGGDSYAGGVPGSRELWRKFRAGEVGATLRLRHPSWASKEIGV